MKLLRILCAFLAIFAAVPAAAYEVGPIRVFLTPAAGRSSATVTINNNRAEELLFEMKAFRRVVARDGSQTLEPADQYFTIFPPQGLVPARKTQAIRFQYKGPPVTGDSQAFVIQVTEVPVMKTGFSGVKFAYNIGVAVYLDAPRAEPRLAVTGAAAEAGKLRFTVENRGRAYGFTAGQALRYRKASGETVTLEPDALAKLIDKPILPPSSTRDFEVEIAGLAPGSVTAVELIDRTR